MDTASKVESFLEAAQQSEPARAALYEELLKLYRSKLWHTIMVKLDTIVLAPEFQSQSTDDTPLVNLYTNVVSTFELKLNFLKLAQFVECASRQIMDVAKADVFIQNVIDNISASQESNIDEPVIYLKMRQAMMRLQDGDVRKIKDMVEEAEQTLEKLTDVDPTVNAAVNWVASRMHKVSHDFTNFYKSTLRYLSYISVERDLDTKSSLAIGFDVVLAAILSKDIYYFGELLQHPLIHTILDSCSESKWLVELLRVFSSGDLEEYDKLCSKYADLLNAQPALVAHHSHMRQKVTVACLLNLVFQLSPDDRKLTLEEIAAATKLPLNDIELLIMKALSVNLIRGVIDQVQGVFYVTWVRPRVLDSEQIASLQERLGVWIEKVHTTLVKVENEVPEFLTA